MIAVRKRFNHALNQLQDVNQLCRAIWVAGIIFVEAS